jgi:hypothetical protein
MVGEPMARPDTLPLSSTEAEAGLLLFQAPPSSEEKEIAALTQTNAGPLIGVGSGYTVTTAVLKLVGVM